MCATHVQELDRCSTVLSHSDVCTKGWLSHRIILHVKPNFFLYCTVDFVVTKKSKIMSIWLQCLIQNEEFNYLCLLKGWKSLNPHWVNFYMYMYLFFFRCMKISWQTLNTGRAFLNIINLLLIKEHRVFSLPGLCCLKADKS